MPCVGIFYLLPDGTLALDSTPLDQAEDRGGDFLVHSRDHQTFWEQQLIRTHPELCFHSYDYCPRGRIIYRVKEAEFILYKDKCIGPKSAEEILQSLDLPRNKTRILSDPHYKCGRCNRHYVSDAIGLND